jgi:hypothetical protein
MVFSMGLIYPTVGFHPKVLKIDLTIEFQARGAKIEPKILTFLIKRPLYMGLFASKKLLLERQCYTVNKSEISYYLPQISTVSQLGASTENVLRFLYSVQPVSASFSSEALHTRLLFFPRGGFPSTGSNLWSGGCELLLLGLQFGF